MMTSAPEQSSRIEAKVSSTEDDVIFGNIVFDGGQHEHHGLRVPGRVQGNEAAAAVARRGPVRFTDGRIYAFDAILDEAELLRKHNQDTTTATTQGRRHRSAARTCTRRCLIPAAAS